MTFKEYQQHAISTALRSEDSRLYILRMVLGLGGEAGEISEKFKKWLRDTDGDTEALDTEDIKKELGDILWYIAGLADELGIDLEDVASTNVEKLASRKQRNTLHGSGDDR